MNGFASGKLAPPRTRAEAQERKAARQREKAAARGGQAQPAPPVGAVAPGLGFPAVLPDFPIAGTYGPPVTPAGTEPGPVPAASGSTTSAFLKRHGAILAPFAYLSATEILAAVDHFAVPGWWYKTLASVGFTAAAGAYALIRNRIKDRAPAMRRTAGWSVALASAWGTTAALWTPFDHVLFGYPLMQCALGTGWLCMSGKYLLDNRHQPVPERKALAAPAEPPYLVMFRHRFCIPGGELAGAVCDNYTALKGGFSLDVHLHGSRGTTATVLRLVDEIAKLYDVAVDQVSVEYQPQVRSEARARVTVITSTAMEDKPVRWDGESTYDPATGCFELGRFMDGVPAHWRWHAPQSGSAHGVISGVTNAGKTGTAHRVACETGLARIDGDRVGFLMLGDPQMQPFSVWRGRAEVTAWGPEACVEMLRWLVEIGKARSAAMGSAQWTDHLERENTGRGWFDPRPGSPLITAVIDEWPLIVALDTVRPGAVKTLGQEAVACAVTIVTQFRKAGIGLYLLSGLPDLEMLGTRAIREMLKAFNAVCHATDALSGNMLGIEGNTTLLPKDTPGIGYTSGPDRRPGTKFRTGYIPEYCAPGDTGVDVRHLAEVIAGTPVRLDRAVQETLAGLGWDGPGTIIDSDTLAGQWEAAAEMDAAHAAGRLEAMSPVKLMALLSSTGALDAGQDAPVLADALRAERGKPVTAASTRDTSAVVLAALSDMGDAWEVMARTGLDALTVNRTLDLLTTDGRVLETTAGRYVACP